MCQYRYCVAASHAHLYSAVRNRCLVSEVYNQANRVVAVSEQIRRPPKNEYWGARTFDVIDPFGNTIFVMGPTT